MILCSATIGTYETNLVYSFNTLLSLKEMCLYDHKIGNLWFISGEQLGKQSVMLKYNIPFLSDSIMKCAKWA